MKKNFVIPLGIFFLMSFPILSQTTTGVGSISVNSIEDVEALFLKLRENGENHDEIIAAIQEWMNEQGVDLAVYMERLKDKKIIFEGTEPQVDLKDSKDSNVSDLTENDIMELFYRLKESPEESEKILALINEWLLDDSQRYNDLLEKGVITDKEEKIASNSADSFVIDPTLIKFEPVSIDSNGATPEQSNEK
jgi:molybdopterin biosynthesis enzyme MoaB